MKGIRRSKRSHNLACASSILNVILQNETGKDLDRSSGSPLALRQDPSDFLDLNHSCQIYVQLVLKKPPGTELPFTPVLFTLKDTLPPPFSLNICYSNLHAVLRGCGQEIIIFFSSAFT